MRSWFGAVALSLVVAGVRAEDIATNPRDTLVYKDGDRVQGKLVAEDAGTIVFKSDRFGELRVPAADAVVIKADPSAATTATRPLPPVEAEGLLPPKKAAKVAEERAEEERVTIWERFSPSLLTAKVRNFFGPWHGRLQLSSEIVSDTAERHNYSLEGRLQRKWERDDVQLNARYDYADSNDVVTTDVLRASGSWRHDFNRRLFAQYRPTTEWNHASVRLGVPNDYLLLQQEIGLGYSVLVRPTRKIRLGVSQNLFDTWNTAPTSDHTSHGVRSLFEEMEFALPWRMNLTQRGVWYPVPNEPDGWENTIELNKKLTETLSTSLRHEIRRHNPDGSAQDYTRLKLLLGFDF
ncbi:MAG TPA: DUF481 domain-containing protein [Opitutaceae bacterium]|nr:DUF481 domain-containing protein [Opitutaceae bacterium]